MDRAGMVGVWQFVQDQMIYVPLGIVMIIVLVLVTLLESNRSLLKHYSTSGPGDIQIIRQGEERLIHSIDLSPITYPSFLAK